MSLDPLSCTVVDDVLVSLRAGTAHLEHLGQVAAPTLLAWSQFDRILPASTCSLRLANEFPGAQFRVPARGWHVPMCDDPSLITATITEWVKSHSADPAGLVRERRTSSQSFKVLPRGARAAGTLAS